MNVIEQERDRAFEKVENDYKAVTAIMWLMPLSGFLGTILGMSSSIGSFNEILSAQSPSMNSLAPAISGLAVAFDTTLVALLLIMPIKILEILMEREDQSLIDEIDQVFGVGLIRTLDLEGIAQRNKEAELNTLTQHVKQTHQELDQLHHSLQKINQDLAHFPNFQSFLDTQNTLLQLHTQILPKIAQRFEDTQSIVEFTSQQSVYTVEQLELIAHQLTSIENNQNQPLTLSRVPISQVETPPFISVKDQPKRNHKKESDTEQIPAYRATAKHAYPAFKSNTAKTPDSESGASKISTPKMAKPNAPVSKISMSKQSWK